jgi:signal transduction histidine kinase
MIPRRSTFERRLLLALVLFSVTPSLALLAAGAYAVSTGVALTGSPAAWERVAESGRTLVERAEQTGDPALAEAAARHRAELGESLTQARRWEFLLRRALLPFVLAVIVLAALIVWLAVRSARGMARELSKPIRTLAGWAAKVAREEPLPEARAGDPEEEGEFGVLRDAFRTMVHELSVSRAKALEAERMHAWVRLARGIAHELKNPLTPMRLAIGSLQSRLQGAPPSVSDALDVISAESARLEELARSFSQFGRLPEGPPSEVDLREMIDYLLRTHLPPQVSPRLRAPIDLPLVWGYHDPLSRAFANLLLNAGEAVGEEGGKVEVTLSRVGEYVEARIQDTGPGIAEEHLERVWEPDFTTKSGGTGLGLALVQQTVQAHGGGIIVQNRPKSGGAEFRVRLPIRGFGGDG